MPVKLPEVNGQKQFLWKILALTMTIIIALISTIWGITWGSNRRTDAKQEERINTLESYIEAQKEHNRMVEKWMGDQHELTMKILEEVQSD